jgi:hypothetical protein
VVVAATTTTTTTMVVAAATIKTNAGATERQKACKALNFPL